MKLYKAVTLSLCSLLFLAACATYPLRMSEEEWNALTPEQQYEARTKQAELDEQARQRRAEEKAREEELEREEALARKKAVRKLYRNGQYGDFIQCVIRKPIVDFHPGWREVNPIGFTLAKTEEKTIKLFDEKRGRTTSIWTRFSSDGMKLYMCRYNPRERKANQCDTMVASYNDFRRGVSHNIDLPDILKGGIECSHAPARGMPNTIIIERE